MNLWFADIGFLTACNHDINHGCNKILNSYAHFEHISKSIERKKTINPKLKLFCDSGAFTAWTKGREINIDEYIKFIKENEEMFEVIANLDKIPGKPGVPETQEDLENAAEVGWNNLLYMNKKGVNPLHIFHQGEDFKWLKKVSEHQEYIGISPNNFAKTKEKRLWLDRVFDFLSNGKGGCRNKTHGFGVTALPLMYRYPWFSCDSSAWSMGRRSGTVRVFIKESKNMFGRAIAISDKVSPDSKIHYDVLDKDTKKLVDKYFEENDLDLEKMRNTHEERDKANIYFFLKVEEDINNIQPKFEKSWDDLF